MDIQRRPDACWGRLSTVRSSVASIELSTDAEETSEIVLWSPVERRLHILNSTAAEVWLELESPTLLDSLVTTMAERFGVEESVVDADVSVLIEQFRSSGLVCSMESASDYLPASPTDADADTEEHTVQPAVRPSSTTAGPFVAMGCPLLIESNDDELSSALASALAPLQASTIDLTDSHAVRLAAIRTDTGWDIERNGIPVGHTRSQDLALRSVLAEVNAVPLSAQRSNVVLHAAGSAFGGDRSVVVFPGISNSGKSTLVAQLTHRGHRYLTDEAVEIDVRSLEAQPFHKAICVEPTAQIVLQDLDHAASTPRVSSTWDVDPRRVGPGHLADEGPIRAFVFPTYSVGEDTQLTPLEPLEVLERLIANAFDFGAVGQPAFAALVRLASTTPSYSLVHEGDGTELTTLESMFVSV